MEFEFSFIREAFIKIYMKESPSFFATGNFQIYVTFTWFDSKNRVWREVQDNLKSPSKPWWLCNGLKTYFHGMTSILTDLIRFLSHRRLCCWRRSKEFGWHPGQTDWQAPGLAFVKNPQNPPNYLKMSWHTPHLLPFPRVNEFCFFWDHPMCYTSDV